MTIDKSARHQSKSS